LQLPGTSSTVDPAEIERFAALADEWWDPRGKFRPLHRMNPARIRFIRDALTTGRDTAGRGTALRALDGLRVLDVGCGGGLVAEPLARLGATVTGVDAAAANVAAAARHAAEVGLRIDYRAGTAEGLARAGERYDAVLALEIVEHVPEPDLLIGACADLLRPGGVLVVSTLNRTLKSLALAKIGAEYVLRWLPAGTHDWRRFVAPAELTRSLGAYGLRVTASSGIAYNVLTDEWVLSRDLDVNYIVAAAKEA
jgi:2-polyprenyl-6-hydroxyphenyl methylase/3-demethylubiquinone-9 3-methyltransferase